MNTKDALSEHNKEPGGKIQQYTSSKEAGQKFSRVSVEISKSEDQTQLQLRGTRDRTIKYFQAEERKKSAVSVMSQYFELWTWLVNR